MENIKLHNIDIPYKISVKKNRNTYFYFKRNGYIQINLSQYQKPQDAINYMKERAEYFVLKYQSNCLINDNIEDEFSIWGTKYEIKESGTNEIIIDHENAILYLPNITLDQAKSKLKIIEKRIMLQYLDLLQKKYQENGYIDIGDITLKTRYTTTRHGSCNPRTKTININLNLVKYDKKYTEYVFLHEISHLKWANHSQNFYKLFQTLCPEYKKLKTELRKVYR